MATPPRRRSRTHSQRSAKSPQHRRRAFVAVERLWGRLADLLGAGPTKQSTPTFNLAPRRLEPRRMLDAAGGAMALEMVAVSTAFAPSSDSADPPPVANLDANTAPSGINVQTPIVINENGVATLSLTFVDPDPLDTHTVEIDWQDGTTEVFSLAAGQTSFSTTHQYLDDNLTGPATEDYDVTIRVNDSAGDFAETTAKISVLNVAPSNLQVSPIAPINENGVATLSLKFDDPGTLDSHTVEINWGDGSAVQVLSVPTGDRAFSATHQYLDDNPSGTSADNYTVSVRLVDDDLGETTATAVATVNNVAPSNVQVKPVVNILSEGGGVALTVTFDDPGSQDTHQVEINWGDGNTTIANAVGHSLNVNHTYGDNATYAIIVKVIDDDGGVGFGSAAALVQNVAPTNVKIDPIAPIDENGVAVLKLTFDDPGTLDSHTVEVDWGDGTVETIAVAAGSRTFTATHRYLDDNPTGTASDNYTVNVKVRDDDGGQATGSAVAKVTNVPPSNVLVSPVATIISEGTQVNLGVTFADAGTQDTHQVEINWGDGTITTGTAVGHALSASHTYGDNGTYAVVVKVIDDDGGEGFGSAAVHVNNVAPANVQIGPIASIDENGIATLNLTFDDPGSLDSHAVEINWGDGTVETLAVAPGVRTLTATHQYLDDNPTGTSSDVYTVNVTVRDDDGGQASASQAITVSNVAPSNVQMAPVVSINENGVATLNLTFDDPGSLDSHTIEINWGDGTVETLAVAAGARTLTTTHQYLDDNPTATSTDVYTVNVTVRDDDGGQASASQTVTVSNVAPSNIQIAPIVSIDENGVATLNLTFDDPGSLDSHTVEINWGDGTVETLTVAAGARTLTATHRYLDDNPTGTSSDVYTVNVTVRDDDGGVATASATVIVNNVAPTGVVATPSAGEINEGSGITLNVTFDDVGSKDTHTYVINWGDGHQTVGGATGHSFEENHVYADNGTYAITVTVTDDDGGSESGLTSVIVNNVNPTLTFTNPTIVVNEGDSITLAGLGVGAADPGFDNGALGTKETFVGDYVDWGDGSTSSLAVDVGVPGSEGNATTGVFSHAAHHYADNGTYTVTVRFKDDDGAYVDRMFTITVENVVPTLTLTSRPLQINEGETLDLFDLATITDRGFDNPNNPNGATKEFFDYVIDWGDGSEKTVGFATIDQLGGPDLETKGSIALTHDYADNDYDNEYTITVTLKDDDGGTITKEIVVTVINVKPTITSISATDVNTKGQTTLTLTFEDPGDDDFTVEVDWGDGKTIIPITVSQLQSDQRTFQYTYTYTEPPNNSAADITLTARVLDDDARRAGVQDNSPSDPAFVTISQPGLGAEKFRIDTSPKVAILTFPDRSVVPLLQTTADARLVAVTTSDDGGGGGDSRATSERYLELRVINPDGSEGPGYRLPSQVLSNLPALFRNLPDNHYKIFLVQSETNARRLVIEVFVRNGKLIDPGDDSEGARDRPPTEEATTRPIEPPPMVAPAEGAAAPADEPAVAEPQAAVEAGRRLRSSTTIYHGATLAGVAIALSGAGKSSCREINDALAKAKPEQWKRLRSAAGRPKKPR